MMSTKYKISSVLWYQGWEDPLFILTSAVRWDLSSPSVVRRPRGDERLWGARRGRGLYQVIPTQPRSRQPAPASPTTPALSARLWTKCLNLIPNSPNLNDLNKILLYCKNLDFDHYQIKQIKNALKYEVSTSTAQPNKIYQSNLTSECPFLITFLFHNVYYNICK